MMRSMFSGVSGLKVHQTKMDVIGNNIANVNTVGFKSQTVSFKDAFYQNMANASGPNRSTGRAGTNPQQVGLGVSFGAISSIMTQGLSQRTDRALDAMIQGEGFFIVRDASGTFFTRAGNIDIDREMNLHINGMQLMGWETVKVDGQYVVRAGAVQPLNLSGEKQYMPPAATTIVDLIGNLTPKGLINNQTERSMTLTDTLGNNFTFDIVFTFHPQDDPMDQISGFWTYEFKTNADGTAVLAFPDGDRKNPKEVAVNVGNSNLGTNATFTENQLQFFQSKGLLVFDTDGRLVGSESFYYSDDLVYKSDFYRHPDHPNFYFDASGQSPFGTLNVNGEWVDPSDGSLLMLVGPTFVFPEPNPNGFTVVGSPPNLAVRYNDLLNNRTSAANDVSAFKPTYDAAIKAVNDAQKNHDNLRIKLQEALNAFDAINNANTLDPTLPTLKVNLDNAMTNYEDALKVLTAAQANLLGSITDPIVLVPGAQDSYLTALLNYRATLDLYDTQLSAFNAVETTLNTLITAYNTARTAYNTAYNATTPPGTDPALVGLATAVDIAITNFNTGLIDWETAANIFYAPSTVPTPTPMPGFTPAGPPFTVLAPAAPSVPARPATHPAGSIGDDLAITRAALTTQTNTLAAAFVTLAQTTPVDYIKFEYDELVKVQSNANFAVNSFQATTSLMSPITLTGMNALNAVTDASGMLTGTLQFNKRVVSQFVDMRGISSIDLYIAPKDATEPPSTFGIPIEDYLVDYNQLDYLMGLRIKNMGVVKMMVDNLTQWGNEEISMKINEIDGNMMGILTDLSISGDGKIMGRYSNGETRVLGQIPVAKFANAAGLERLGNNLFAVSANSGAFDGVGDVGEVLGMALEMSNVDLAQEFTDMIVTQRGFQANSRIITVTDDMLQELVNLKR
jgi:flagellar hook-basal body protein